MEYKKPWNNTCLWICLLVLAIAGLAVHAKEPKLKPGSKGYRLAKDLASKLPVMDPDENKVLARCDGFEVTSGELIQILINNFGFRTGDLKLMETPQLRSRIQSNAQDLLVRKLLLREAQKANVTVKPSEVDSVLEKQYERAGGKTKYKEFLKANGIGLHFVVQDLRRGLTIQRHLDTIVAQQVKVTEQEIKTGYAKPQKVTVRHILLQTRGLDEAGKKSVRGKLEGILKLARSGKGFAALAKKYSEDPGSKDNGGLYKDIEQGQMVKPFEDAAFSVLPGKISNIVETKHGYHIIKVLQRQKQTKPFKAVRSQLKERLEKQKQRQAFEDYVDKLKRESNLTMAEM